MAYLIPSSSAVRNRKLAGFVPARRYQPGLLSGFYRRTRGRIRSGVAGLGQEVWSEVPAIAPYGPPTIEETPAWILQAMHTTPTSVVDCPPPLTCSSGQGSGAPVDQAYRDLITSARQSSDPLDYVSPQAAIAAGLEAQTVYTAWVNALRSQIASGKIKSQQDAIAQGWAPGVVTQLWAQASAAVVGTSASWLDQAPLGIANKWLLAGGAGIFALVSMRGRR